MSSLYVRVYIYLVNTVKCTADFVDMYICEYVLEKIVGVGYCYSLWEDVVFSDQRNKLLQHLLPMLCSNGINLFEKYLFSIFIFIYLYTLVLS